MRSIRPEEITSIRKQYGEGVSTIELSAKFNISESNVQYIVSHSDIMSGFKNLDELKQKIASHCYIVTKEQCLDLPKKVYEKMFVEMSAEQKRVYNELKKDMLTRYADKELTVTNKMVLVGRLQQITGGFFPYQDIYIDEFGEERRLKKESKAIMISGSNPKLNALVSDLDEIGDEQLIIWCRFIAEIKSITEYFKAKLPNISVGAYFGGVTRTERGWVIEKFKAKKLRVLIANPRTAGIGLNLQVAHLCYYFSNDFSLENRKQSEDRIHRIPQTSVCVYKDILCKDTIDEKVHAVLEEKNNLLGYFRETSLVDILKQEDKED
jgi:SNF2 family DNA or RNA helicase